MKIKNKGFSLVELLVAIAIIGLISGVAGFFIITTINNSKEKSNKIAINNMKTSANTYIKEYYDEVVWKVNGTNNLNESCISIQTLVSKGYLSKNVLEESETQKSIILTKDDNNTIIKETIIDTDCDSYEQIVDIPTKKDICNDLSYNGSGQQLYDYERLISTGNYKTIKYKDTQYNETNLPINAGEYDVEFELEEGKVWQDNTRDIKRITCSIKKASPELSLVPNGNSDETIGSNKTYLKSKTSGTITIKSSNKNHATAKVTDKNIIAGTDKEIEIITLSSRKTPTYITIKVTPTDSNYKEEEIVYTVGKVENKKINKPTCLNPYYNKEEQNLIKEDESYILYNNKQTDIGNYQVTARLNYGYTWSDGTTNDATITCEIKRPTPTVTYINNSGSGCTNKTVTYEEKYGELCTPTRTGYTFQGWYSDSNLTNEINSESQVVNIYNHNLYAKWEVNKIFVQYHVNGGTWIGTNKNYGINNAGLITKNNSTIVDTFNYGTTVDPHNYNYSGYINISRTGYAAKSGSEWNTSSDGTGTSINQTGTDANNICDASKGNCTATLYVNWKPNKIKLSFNQNGGSGGMSNVWYYYGINKFYSNEACTNEITSITKPTRTGYTFVHYYGNGTSGGNADERYAGYDNIVFASDLCTDIYTDATLYAKWQANTYTITYNDNGGSGGPGSQNFVFNSGTKISSTKPTRTGYTFVNWTYSGHTFNPGDSIPAGWGSFTLTANWQQTATTVKFDIKRISNLNGNKSMEYKVTVTNGIIAGVGKIYTSGTTWTLVGNGDFSGAYGRMTPIVTGKGCGYGGGYDKTAISSSTTTFTCASTYSNNYMSICVKTTNNKYACTRHNTSSMSVGNTHSVTVTAK